MADIYWRAASVQNIFPRISFFIYLSKQHRQAHTANSIHSSVRICDYYSFRAALKTFNYHKISQLATKRSYLHILKMVFPPIDKWRLLTPFSVYTYKTILFPDRILFREKPWVCLQPVRKDDTGLCLEINATSFTAILTDGRKFSGIIRGHFVPSHITSITTTARVCNCVLIHKVLNTLPYCFRATHGLIYFAVC